MNDTNISVRDLHLYYGENHALKGINMEIHKNSITALIGPSGCGKSTFLKTLNRMNDLVDNVNITGSIKIDNHDIYGPNVDVTALRKKVGMVFQQPNPFPMSIYDNVAYGPRIHGIKDHRKLDKIVEDSLKGAAIYDEVKDRLKKSALGLSGGQQRTIVSGQFFAELGAPSAVAGSGAVRELLQAVRRAVQYAGRGDTGCGRNEEYGNQFLCRSPLGTNDRDKV